jgi:membrane-associated protease RseP (regulator of RpoE activity)
MTKRSIIILLTTTAALGAAAGTGMARPDRSKPDTKTDAQTDARKAPDATAPDRSDTFEFTVRAGKGRLGVAVLQISPELRAHLGAPGDRGVLVDAVKPDSPAARAGVRVGDVILEVDGEAAASATDVLDAIGDRKKGEAVAIAVVRGGQRQELRATLEDDAGPAWRRGRLGPRARPHFDPGRWFDDPPSFGGLDRDARRSLDEARERIEELERRLERLERR